jgi:hypothetical protein
LLDRHIYATIGALHYWPSITLLLLPLHCLAIFIGIVITLLTAYITLLSLLHCHHIRLWPLHCHHCLLPYCHSLIVIAYHAIILLGHIIPSFYHIIMLTAIAYCHFGCRYLLVMFHLFLYITLLTLPFIAISMV